MPRRGSLAALLLLLGLAVSCPLQPAPPLAPRVVLWAWERPEDLSFLANPSVEVSVLLATLELRASRWRTHSRQQPIRLPAGKRPRGTIRLEMRDGASLAHYSPAQLRGVAQRLVDLARARDVSMLQIDFDARESEQAAYLVLLRQTRELLGASRPLSITGLASWCTQGSWLEQAPWTRSSPSCSAWARRGPRGAPGSRAAARRRVAEAWASRSTSDTARPPAWTRSTSSTPAPGRRSRSPRP
ncbi:hypothetical protein VZQ01_31925 [Myxococcus faecalis]|uniref:hypothetical protein n=1 Tax=Myxococcus faecalis TaxID=3115646 RepID=UPI003CEB20FF